ncbi:ParM/StbA family protein [Clostridium pasteurianum]|uniref:ParM/StbA family protein n=1 Tax=Clostridium pasteurianum TaxID=1501 RepID=UPI002260ED4F|nr:ParM/StbA family protein [Clostridium pasteurianum]UZW12846.1 ParM/StbA family protein [Clostridium pasteurianum]
MKELLLSIDTGKSYTKTITKIGDKIEKVLFRTKVQEISELGVDVTPNSYLIEYQGKSYLIGDMISENSCNFQITKHTIDHQLSIYLAICKIIDRTEALKYGLPKVHLALNIPINSYKNITLKADYKNFMQNNGEIIYMKVNGTEYAFKISSIIVLPEAMGPLYCSNRINDFRNKVTVIDIGSLNVNYCTYNNLVPELDSMNISNNGINVLRAKIAEKLTATYGTLITDDDVEEILRNDGYLYISGIKKPESKEIIEKLITNHVAEIFNYGRSRGLTFNNTNLVFVGGGSLLLKNYILTQYPLAVIEEDGQFSNCSSYLNILEVKKNVG